MNVLNTRRYTELVDRMNGICGLLSRYLSLKLKRAEDEGLCIVLLRDEKSLKFFPKYIGLFDSRANAQNHIENTEKIPGCTFQIIKAEKKN